MQRQEQLLAIIGDARLYRIKWREKGYFHNLFLNISCLISLILHNFQTKIKILLC
jgi:hypothetical protein